jgi:hypothetical protein
MPRSGNAGSAIPLIISFRSNAVLFDPFEVLLVEIYDAQVGGNLLDTIVPIRQSVGVYEAVYYPPVTLPAGVYWESWSWRAEEQMALHTKRYDLTIYDRRVRVHKPRRI